MSKFTLTEGIKWDEKNVSSGREIKFYIYIDMFRNIFSESGTYTSNLCYFQDDLLTEIIAVNRNIAIIGSNTETYWNKVLQYFHACTMCFIVNFKKNSALSSRKT